MVYSEDRLVCKSSEELLAGPQEPRSRAMGSALGAFQTAISVISSSITLTLNLDEMNGAEVIYYDDRTKYRVFLKQSKQN